MAVSVTGVARNQEFIDAGGDPRDVRGRGVATARNLLRIPDGSDTCEAPGADDLGS
ncbi:hypothetical protein GCM10010339_19640 [Streptomyces alanosinicus]|uniref:Uncharacterized protein n=1 Tax=Streptomyces alanosinicus TaxID=68171 RepID=A0A919D126_9ACTN|nr:hypothetical protein GCM10010339_19640 [Streptomyces alanosinicus]